GPPRAPGARRLIFLRRAHVDRLVPTRMQDVELEIRSRTREIVPGISVERLLPFAQRHSVGPYVFFDHGGPREIPPGGAADILPHPHIGLSTVTYLFEGELVHR